MLGWGEKVAARMCYITQTCVSPSRWITYFYYEHLRCLVCFSYDSKIISPDFYWHIQPLIQIYIRLYLLIELLWGILPPISCRCCLPSCRYGGGAVGHTRWRAPPMWLRWGWGRDTRGLPHCWGLQLGERPLWASRGPCPGRQRSRTEQSTLSCTLQALFIITDIESQYTIPKKTTD